MLRISSRTPAARGYPQQIRRKKGAEAVSRAGAGQRAYKALVQAAAQADEARKQRHADRAVQREHAEKAKGDGTLMIRSTGEFDELQLRLDAVEDELFSTHSLLSMARQKNARLSERLEELHEERLKTSHQFDVEDARAELAVQADTNKRLATRLKELSQKLDHSHALEADAQEARAELAVQADTNKRLAARVQSLQEIVDKLDIKIPNLPNLASQVSLPLDGSA